MPSPRRGVAGCLIGHSLSPRLSEVLTLHHFKLNFFVEFSFPHFKTSLFSKVACRKNNRSFAPSSSTTQPTAISNWNHDHQESQHIKCFQYQLQDLEMLPSKPFLCLCARSFRWLLYFHSAKLQTNEASFSQRRNAPSACTQHARDAWDKDWRARRNWNGKTITRRRGRNLAKRRRRCFRSSWMSTMWSECWVCGRKGWITMSSGLGRTWGFRIVLVWLIATFEAWEEEKSHNDWTYTLFTLPYSQGGMWNPS